MVVMGGELAKCVEQLATSRQLAITNILNKLKQLGSYKEVWQVHGCRCEQGQCPKKPIAMAIQTLKAPIASVLTAETYNRWIADTGATCNTTNCLLYLSSESLQQDITAGSCQTPVEATGLFAYRSCLEVE